VSGQVGTEQSNDLGPGYYFSEMITSRLVAALPGNTGMHFHGRSISAAHLVILYSAQISWKPPAQMQSLRQYPQLLLLKEKKKGFVGI